MGKVVQVLPVPKYVQFYSEDTVETAMRSAATEEPPTKAALLLRGLLRSWV